MKYRVIQAGNDCRYYPQFKPGLFWNWRFFVRDAETTNTTLVRWIGTFEQIKAASFPWEEEGHRFIDRVIARVDSLVAERNAVPPTVEITKVSEHRRK